MTQNSFEIRPSIFREYDVRGIAGQDLSPEFAECLGLAYATLLVGRAPAQGRPHLTVAVGRDCRLTGEAYATALIRGMQKGGLDVVDIGVCPTPLTYFSIFQLDLDGGVMVTGSHNPADYNGFKICIGKDTLHGARIQELRERMIQVAQSGAVSDRVGLVCRTPMIPTYIEHLLKGAKKVRSMKVVLDAGNGTASTVAPELFERLGAEVIPLYCELDGRFPNHHPDPTVPSNLRDLIAKVRETGAAFGVGFDGDSDRIGAVDENGRILFGDELMVIFARDVLQSHPGATIISEVKSSHRLYNDIAAKGGNGIMWKTGHSLIKSKMKETGAALAGEMSGHIFFADRYFGYDDAIYAALRLYEIASAHTGPVSSLVADLPETLNTPEIRIDCIEEKKFALVEETKRLLQGAAGSINDIDGVRISFSDGWGLVRASNTQPVLVLRFESTTQAGMSRIRTLVETALAASASTLGHPVLDLSGGAH